MSTNDSSDFSYQGDELDDFFLQKNWGNYVLSMLKGTFQGKCVEIGAGLGYFSKPISCFSTVSSISLYEPDSKNFQHLKESFKESNHVVLHNDFYLGGECCDTFILMDVLEHIENDKKTLELLRDNLNPKGRIVLLLPAHMFLYSEFDKSIGHFRRYNKKMLLQALPSGLKLRRCQYLDSVGMLASLFARASGGQPKKWQLWVWDKILVNLSRLFDFLFFYKMGKSMIVVLEKEHL